MQAPKCSCRKDSRSGLVFTCPQCVKAALGRLYGGGVDQVEMFSDIDSRVSVSGLVEGEELSSPDRGIGAA